MISEQRFKEIQQMINRLFEQGDLRADEVEADQGEDPHALEFISQRIGISVEELDDFFCRRRESKG